MNITDSKTRIGCRTSKIGGKMSLIGYRMSRLFCRTKK